MHKARLPILTQLKQHTQTQHADLERKLDVLAHTQSHALYCRLLQQFWGLYAPLEARLGQIEGWSDLNIDFDARRKAPLLEHDLEMLGLTSTELASLPICQELPALMSLAHGLGCMYVLEGATLGGQIISRHLVQQIAVTPITGGAFFASYGAQLGPMWRAFGQALSLYATTPSHVEIMLDTACATFEAFERWL